MASKWTRVLFMAVIVVVVALVPAGRAEATCSGDDCGCNIEEEECRASCPPEGEPGHLQCLRACARASVRCAVCCCCQCYACPPYCGGGLSVTGLAPSPGSELLVGTLPRAANQCVTSSRGGETVVDQCVPPGGDELFPSAQASTEQVGRSW